MSLRLFCDSQNYRSHARAAQAYIDIFASLPASLVTLVDDPDEANVAYLHMEPEKAAELMRQVPSLKKAYRIGYCVWEAETLPEKIIRAITQLDEVWTASWYNWTSFSKIHTRVRWIPHVTGNIATAHPTDVAAMRALLGLEGDAFTYLYIGEDIPRKNISGLAGSFAYVHKRRPNTRLIIKTMGTHPTVAVARSGPVTYCTGNLADKQIAALYALCDTYVSAHFAEGWGLTLTDAMSHGKLCVATNYSGNTDFMTRGNSLLATCSVGALRPKHCIYLFTTAMAWGYPHPESLEQQMLEAHRLVTTDRAEKVIARAKRDVRCFDARHVRCLVRHRLTRIAQKIAAKQLAPSATQSPSSNQGRSR